MPTPPIVALEPIHRATPINVDDLTTTRRLADIIQETITLLFRSEIEAILKKEKVFFVSFQGTDAALS